MNNFLLVHSKPVLRMLSIIILFAVCHAVCHVDAQQNSPHSLRMVSAAVPFYPQDAEAAGIEGTIVIEVQVLDGVVVDADANDGPLILRQAALANVQTWHFDAALTTKFHTTFTYKLLAASGCGAERQRLITLKLPYSALITSSYLQTCDPVVDTRPHP